MRFQRSREIPWLALRLGLERLDGLPLRPATARLVLDACAAGQAVPVGQPTPAPPAHQPVEQEADPGWELARSRRGAGFDPLQLVAERSWWTRPSGPGTEALEQLWRHAVAVGLAARRLAQEVGDPEPGRVARAGLLHGLGRWALAALDPERLARWLRLRDPRRRRQYEVESVGVELATLGRTLAERWQCDSLVVDAAWLHADRPGELGCCALEPARLVLIQRAYHWAERTPWALGGREPGASRPADDCLRRLVAEVQARCGGWFVEADATPHEERWARSNARLLGRLDHLSASEAAQRRLLEALAGSDPSEDPVAWAERAGSAWGQMPGATAALVAWTGGAAPPASCPSPGTDPGTGAVRPEPPTVPLVSRGRECARIQLQTEVAGRPVPPEWEATVPAWRAWAALVGERAGLEKRLETVLRAHRDYVEEEELRGRHARLDALAQFAAGAGHELNNPLAVIVGRAQLLLAGATEPGTVRSLRAILAQAQRAHRMLRDLMYVARTPPPRPRACHPGNVLRDCLRDLEAELAARQVRVVVEDQGPDAPLWSDPDALRHLAEILLRNGLEATAEGATIRVTARDEDGMLRWTFQDHGRGMSSAEAEHLFDLFYCGRQAGRGLGLGLPRAARAASRLGGELRWHSAPGRGTTFQVHLPRIGPPPPLATVADPRPPVEEPASDAQGLGNAR